MLFPVMCRDCNKTIPNMVFTSSIHHSSKLCKSCNEKEIAREAFIKAEFDEAHDEMFYSLEDE